MQQEYHFSCPYCWSSISMVIDLSVDEQTYIEDCEVCCNPIAVHYRVSDDGYEAFVADFEASRAQ